MSDPLTTSEEVLLREAWLPLTPASEESSTIAGSLYLQYAPVLRRIACRKYDIPVMDVDALVHDVFATYLTNPGVVRDARAYLVGGICNASREYWRERRREVALPDDEEPVVPQTLLEGLSARLTVAATVARLRSRCRELLRRRYFEDEATDVIAAAIDTTPRNVLYLLHICRGRARKIYETLTRVR
jgi:DNA-directed RNA polymerase specialized sigma24 family protein